MKGSNQVSDPLAASLKMVQRLGLTSKAMAEVATPHHVENGVRQTDVSPTVLFYDEILK